MTTRTLRTWARVLLASAATLLAVTVVAMPAAADDDDPSVETGIGLWVPVLPTHAKTGSSATGASASNGTSASGSSVVTEAQAQPAAGDMLVAGGLYIGDINASARPTINPFEGRSELWITLRNLSTDTIDATADFSLATFYGDLIDGTQIAVTGVKPEETRVVGTTLQGAGQWPFVVGRVTVHPPDTIAGQSTAPVSRATVVYVFPWLLVIALVLVTLALVLLRLSARVFAAPVTPAASAA